MLSNILKDTHVAAPKSMKKDKAKDSLVYICEQIPHLHMGVQSIEKGEFVEFTNLLPKSAPWEEETFMEVTEKVLVLTQGKAMPKRKTITDIETWMEAFCTYMYPAVRSKKHPEDIPEPMAYAPPL